MKKILSFFYINGTLLSSVTNATACNIKPAVNYYYYDDQNFQEKKVKKSKSETMWNDYDYYKAWPLQINKSEIKNCDEWYKLFNNKIPDTGIFKNRNLTTLITNYSILNSTTLHAIKDNNLLKTMTNYLILNFPSIENFSTLDQKLTLDVQLIFINTDESGNISGNNFDNNLYWLDVLYERTEQVDSNLLLNLKYSPIENDDPGWRRGITDFRN